MVHDRAHSCFTGDLFTLARKSNMVAPTNRGLTQINSCVGLMLSWALTDCWFHSDGPKLSSLDRGHCRWFLQLPLIHHSVSHHAGPQPITYAQFQKFIKAAVASVGLDPNDFSSHSFRRGRANWAFSANVPSELIKVQGDWASQAYLRYLDCSVDQRVVVSHSMSQCITQLNL